MPIENYEDSDQIQEELKFSITKYIQDQHDMKTTLHISR